LVSEPEAVFTRQDNLDQGLLLPPSPCDRVPADHLAWFISETVDGLDLDDFLERYRVSGKREQACPPRVRL
jgi:hypothetical protein